MCMFMYDRTATKCSSFNGLANGTGVMYSVYNHVHVHVCTKKKKKNYPLWDL